MEIVHDGRLQVLLPTDVQAERYYAHTAFDVVARAVGVDPSTHDWQEAEVVEKPFECFLAMGDEKRGLAFIGAGGLHEGGVRDDPRRTMQITLLRSSRRTVGTEGEPDGLMLGTVAFDYALLPFSDKMPVSEALRLALRMQAGIATRQSGARASGFNPLPREGETTVSYLTQTDGDLVLSAMKPAEDGGGLVLRLWNPYDRPATATLQFRQRPQRVVTMRLDETPEHDIKIQQDEVTVQARGHQILTLGIYL